MGQVRENGCGLNSQVSEFSTSFGQRGHKDACALLSVCFGPGLTGVEIILLLPPPKKKQQKLVPHPTPIGKKRKKQNTYC